MIYNELITDFADRTKRNLDFVQKRVRDGDEGIYDVTQLWNSLLGLIVLPLETDKKNGNRRIPATPMTELGSQGWPRLTKNGDDNESLHNLVWHLRHAVAHANVEFIPRSDGQIISVKMWNESRSGARKWSGQATVEELEADRPSQKCLQPVRYPPSNPRTS